MWITAFSKSPLYPLLSESQNHILKFLFCKYLPLFKQKEGDCEQEAERTISALHSACGFLCFHFLFPCLTLPVSVTA